MTNKSFHVIINLLIKIMPLSSRAKSIPAIKRKGVCVVKKLTAIMLCFSLVFCMSAVLSGAEESIIDVPAAKVTPVIDGKISEGEYSLLGTLEDGTLELESQNGADPEAEFYASWDEDNFYLAIRVTCEEPHSAYMDNASEHYIFNGHNVMAALIPEDPAQSKYEPANGEYWLWADAYNNGVCYEWTTILDSKTGAVVTDNHFLTLTKSAGFKAACTSEGGYDIYEMQIAFSEFKTTYSGVTEFKAEVGSVFGFDFNAGLMDIGAGYDGENGEYKGDYVRLGGFFKDARGTIADECARLRLAPEAEDTDESTESSEPSSESSIESSDTQTPSTGDNGYIVYVLVAIVAAAAIVSIFMVRARKKSIIDGDDDGNI